MLELFLLEEVGSADDALAVAEKIRQALAEPFELFGHTLQIGSSLGVALYPEHGLDEVALVRHADVAMYAAQRERTQ